MPSADLCLGKVRRALGAKGGLKEGSERDRGTRLATRSELPGATGAQEGTVIAITTSVRLNWIGGPIDPLASCSNECLSVRTSVRIERVY